MKRLPHIPKSGRSKTVLSLAICLCFGTAAVTSGFGQNEPKPTSIEEKTKIHRLATTKRAGKAEKIDEAYGKMRLNKGDLHQLMAFLNLLNDVPDQEFRNLILNATILDTSDDIE